MSMPQPIDPMPDPGPAPVPGLGCADQDTIVQILAKETGINRNLLRLDARLSDLEIPSLDLVQTIFALESRFDIEIPVVADRAGAEFETVGQMVAHVQAAIDRSQAPAHVAR